MIFDNRNLRLKSVIIVIANILNISHDPVNCQPLIIKRSYLCGTHKAKV